MTARLVRIGTGAAYSEDRIDPGIASLGWTGALKGFETNVGGYLNFAGGGLTRAWLER